MVDALIREADPEDYRAIGANLRDSDVREIEGLIDVPPILALKYSIDQSEYCRIVDVEGEPSMAFGVMTDPGCEDYGLVWFMSTSGVYKVRRRFLRESKDWVDRMFASGPYVRLHNIADTRNTLHMRWLKWLGAKFSGDMIRQHYQRFEMRR